MFLLDVRLGTDTRKVTVMAQEPVCCGQLCCPNCACVRSNPIISTIIGGLLALTGGIVGVALSDRRERRRWLRDSQLRVSTELLSALQLLIRRMIDMAYLEPEESVNQDSPTVAAFNEAAVIWNRAMYGALLIAEPQVATKIPEFDREVDRLKDLAVARSWDRDDFRNERLNIGRMAADYLRHARKVAGLPDIQLESTWTWDREAWSLGSQKGHRSLASQHAHSGTDVLPTGTAD